VRHFSLTFALQILHFHAILKEYFIPNPSSRTCWILWNIECCTYSRSSHPFHYLNAHCLWKGPSCLQSSLPKVSLPSFFIAQSLHPSKSLYWYAVVLIVRACAIWSYSKPIIVFLPATLVVFIVFTANFSRNFLATVECTFTSVLFRWTFILIRRQLLRIRRPRLSADVSLTNLITSFPISNMLYFWRKRPVRSYTESLCWYPLIILFIVVAILTLYKVVCKSKFLVSDITLGLTSSFISRRPLRRFPIIQNGIPRWLALPLWIWSWVWQWRILQVSTFTFTRSVS